jgi:hypothetical protein
MLFLLSLALALTRPTSDQLRDVEQARVPCPCDRRSGTFISTDQLSDERYVGAAPDGMFTDSVDQMVNTVCITIWERVTYEDGTGVNLHHLGCYTQYGLGLLLTDPTWKSWWDTHQPG